ncbi:MAG: hypothetical protein PHH04_03800 [Thomasclavelia sp.]|nr:hypothetical protein [Thomasclavelia sp.]
MPDKTKATQISIDEQMVQYAEKILPIVYQITYYQNKQVELFEMFNNYKGGAQKEVLDHQEGVLKQINTIAEGYNMLATNLQELIEAFLKQDTARAQQFYNNIVSNTGKSLLIEMGVIEKK